MKVLLMTIFTRIYRPCFSSASLTKESVLRALYAMMVLVLSVPFEANAERTLTSRFNTNVNGNIVQLRPNAARMRAYRQSMLDALRHALT